MSLESIGEVAVQELNADRLGDVFKGSTGVVKEAVKAALAAKQERMAAQLGEAVIEVIDKLAFMKAKSVASIRIHRRAEKDLLAQLDEYDRAIAYGQSTGNFVPAASVAGENHYGLSMTPQDFAKLSIIPASFKAPAKKK